MKQITHKHHIIPRHAEGKMDNRAYSEEGLKRIKESSSKVGKRVHQQRIKNDWHKNGPGR
jgi:hypothetical protein